MKYIYDKENDRMVEKTTGEPMVSGEWTPVTPQVFGDIEGYQSPVDGSWVEGRRARRYDLEKNNCIDANDLSTPKPLKNERFVKKHGLHNLSEQYKEV